MGKKLSEEDIKRNEEFWQRANNELKDQKPLDSRTQAILYAYSDAQTFFGVTLDELGKKDQAKEVYMASLQLSQYNGIAPHLIAQKYLEAKNFDKAIEWEEKALLANPSLAFSHQTLGTLYLEQKNDKKKAYFHFQKYLILAPQDQDQVQIQQIIERLKQEL